MNYTSPENLPVKLNSNLLGKFIAALIQFVYRLIANYIPEDNFLQEFAHKKGWWVEIFSAKPAGLYYFGHFDSQEDAQKSLDGFVQDLVDEGANNLKTQLQFCQPKRLTVGL
jgi:Domain of unknown function (DUF1816)